MARAESPLYRDVPLSSPRSIRLLSNLHIRSQSPTGLAVCFDLGVESLDGGPEYRALSYTWDAPTPKAAETMSDKPVRSVICGQHALLVTQNLFDFLTQMARNSHCGPFWIDAVCIDQSNDVEKNQQVNMMADIYQTAHEVLIWLGKADATTGMALKIITDFGDPRGQIRRTLSDDLHSTDSAAFTNLLPALASLFDRTWFTRVWVVQEFVLARRRKVLCGDFLFSWDAIAEISDYLATRIPTRVFAAAGANPDAYKNPAKLAAAVRDLEGANPDILLNSLVRFRSYDSTKMHDKAYSLLGIYKVAMKLENATPNSLLYPRYGADVARAYTDVATYLVQNKPDVQLLFYAEGSDFQNIPGLPSWVPDWSVKASLGLGITGYQRYSASGTESCVKRVLSGDLLELRAARLDAIVQVGETNEEVYRGRPFVQWLDILASIPRHYHTRQGREEVFWRTLCKDTASDRTVPALPATERSFVSWILAKLAALARRAKLDEEMQRAWIAMRVPFDRLHLDSAFILPDLHTILDLSEQNDEAQSLVKSRAVAFDTSLSHSLLQRLFRTGKGYLGSGSQSMKTGDSVWIVPGSRVPLIFRPSGNGGGRLKLVGGAYVHGFMSGEALRDEGLTFQNIIVE